MRLGAENQTLISIHAPPAGSDTDEANRFYDTTAFQSTLPLRGATQRMSWCIS